LDHFTPEQFALLALATPAIVGFAWVFYVLFERPFTTWIKIVASELPAAA